MEAARKQLQSLSGKKKVVEVPVGPQLPLELGYLWGWYCELANARTSNGFGANPITWVDMCAWAAMTGNKPEPWEIRAIMRLDGAFLKAMNTEEKKTT